MTLLIVIVGEQS